MEDCLCDPYWPLRIFGYAYGLVNAPPFFRTSCTRCSESTSIASSWYTSMISSSTLGASSTSSSKLRNSNFINQPYNSWVIILTVVAFGWTRGRWRPLRPGHNPQLSKNSNASWDSPTSTAASYRTTVPLPIHSRTYSATSPSLCPGP